MRIGFAAIPYNENLLPVTSRKSASETVARLTLVARYVGDMDIDFYRLPANISPRENLDSIEAAKDDIGRLGDLFRRLNIRTCFHSTYFCILNSPADGVVRKSIDELRSLCLFDRYFGGGNHVEVHAGGSYGNREAAIGRFISVTTALEEDIFRMLRLENEEHAGKIGTVDEVLRISGETGIPLVFDVAHFRVNRLEAVRPARDIVEQFLATWKRATTFPVLHYSTTAPGKGTHLPVDPGEFWQYIDLLEGLQFDVMLETKEKEKDVVRVREWQTED